MVMKKDNTENKNSESCFAQLGKYFTDASLFIPTAIHFSRAGEDMMFIQRLRDGTIKSGACEVKAIHEGKHLHRSNNRDKDTGELTECGCIEVELWENGKYGWLFEYTHPSLFNHRQTNRRLEIMRKNIPSVSWTRDQMKKLCDLSVLNASDETIQAIAEEFEKDLKKRVYAKTPTILVQTAYTDTEEKPENLIDVIVFPDFPKLVTRLNEINGGRWNIGLEKDKEPDKSTWHYLQKKEFDKTFTPHKAPDIYGNMWYVPLDKVADLAIITLTNTARTEQYIESLSGRKKQLAIKRYEYLKRIAQFEIPDIPAELEKIRQVSKTTGEIVLPFEW